MKVTREDVFKVVSLSRLAVCTKEEISELLEESLDSLEVEEAVFECIKSLYQGVTNEYLSEIYEVISGKKVEVIGEIANLFSCPCCSYLTLTESYDEIEGTGYDICDHCGWEDDGTIDIEKRSGVNHGSISDYRKRLAKTSSKFKQMSLN